MPDIRFENHGSIWLMTAQTDAGTEWLEEHIGDDAQTWGKSIVVEPRYVGAIVDGAADDGLEVEI